MANYFDKYDESAPTGNYFDKYDEPEKKADGGDFLRGAKESFQQLPQLGYGLIAGAGAALENVAGEGGIATGIKKAGIAGYKDWGDTIAKGSKESDSWDYSYEQAKQGNFGSLVDWLQHGLGYVGGQAVQTLATGGIGYAGGKFAANTAAKQIAEGMVAKEAAKLTAENAAAKLTTEQIAKQATANVAAKFAAIGQTSALAANAVGMEGGEILGGLTSENADRPLTGAELGKAFVATLAAGGLEFVGDKLGLDIMLGKSALLKPAEKATGILGRAARGGIAAAGAMPIEGGTEFGQTLLEEYGKGKDPFSADAMKQARESAALGALGGMAIGGVGGAIRGPKVDEQKPADTPAAPVLQIGNTPEDILKAPDADSAIAAFTASLDAPDAEAAARTLGPLAAPIAPPLAAIDDPELARLVQGEARDLNTLRALAVEDARKQRELDSMQATGAGAFDAIQANNAATVEAPTALQLAMQRAQAKAAPATNAPAPSIPAIPGDSPGNQGTAQVVTVTTPDRQPDILPGDISREDGTPFKSESGAKYKQRFAGGIDGSEIVSVQGGYVIRPKAPPTDPVAAAPGQTAGMQPVASAVPAPTDPSQSINQPLNQEIQSATQADQAVQSPPQRQEPTARAAPVPAPVPDPVQPAEGSTVPAQAQTDPRLIPVSKRAPAQPTEGPGSDAGNGFKQGPKQGERYRVGVVAAAGGAVSLEKRLPAGTAATFYVGKDGNLIDGDSVNFIGTGRDKLWIPATPEQAQQAQAILDEMGRLALNDPARQAAKARLKALVLQGNTNAGAPNAADVARPGGQRADDRSGSDGVAGVPDQRPSDVLASPAATEGQEAAGQEPTAGPAPVPAVNPDPVQPAESGAVPAQAKDQRLIPVSQRAQAQPDDLTDDQTTAEFERLYQEDVKADIRRRLGMEPAAREDKPTTSPFRTFLRKYGISPQHASDITGERGIRANNRLPATFRRNGLALDELALRAVEDGYLTQADLESGADNGGTNKLMEMIQAEIRGERQTSNRDASGNAEDQMERVRQAELEGMANQLGIPYPADIDPMALASMVSRVQRALDASREPKGSTKAERVRLNAIAAAQRIEAKRQKYEREMEEFAKADAVEQNAFLEVLMDDDGTPVVNRLADLEAEAAWNATLGTWSDQNGQSTRAEVAPARQAEAPDAQAEGERPGDAQEGDTGQQRRSDQGQEEGLSDDEANARAGELIDRHRAEFAKTPSGMTADQFHDYQDRRRDADKAVAAEILKLAGNGDGLLLPWKSGTSLIALHKDPRTEGAWRTTTFLPDMTPAGHMEFNTPMEAAAFFRDSAKGKEPAGLTAPTRADVLRQQAQAEAEAARKEQGGDKPVERKVTGDTPDMFNTQGSVFDQPAEPGQSAITPTEAGNVAMFARSTPFYSALSSEISGINARAMTAGDWGIRITGLVKQGKVKQDEVTWSGVLDWLKLQEGKVTREQVVQFLDANGVKVEETVLGGDNQPPGYDADIELLSDNGLTLERNPEDPGMVAFMDENGDLLRADELAEEPGLAKELVLAAYRVQEAAEAGKVPTKYGTYQLPGGTKYREVLLTLPSRLGRWEVRLAEGKWRPWNNETQDWGRRPDGKLMAGYDTEAEGRKAISVMGGGQANNFRSGHWDQPNVLAHIRVNDRVDADGKRVLFVEELQSDFAQEGRKRGFREPFDDKAAPSITAKTMTAREFAEERSMPAAAAKFWLDGRNDIRRDLGEAPMTMDDMVTVVYEGGTPKIVKDGAIPADKAKAAYEHGTQRIAQERRALHEQNQANKLPRAPFVERTDAWLSLALKRIVKMAVDEGYDRVAFVNGDQSAERYDLSTQTDRISWEEKTGSFEARGVPGKKTIRKGNVKAEDLPGLIGKEVADRLMNASKTPQFRGDTDGPRILTGLDLKVGGEGMKAFYDKIVPNTLKDVLRKVGGGALETVGVQAPYRNDGDRNATVNRFREQMVAKYGDGIMLKMTTEERQKLRRLEDGGITLDQPGFTITPAMQEKAANGLPLFDRKAGQTGGTPAQKVRLMAAPIAKRLHIDLRVVDTPAGLPIPAPSDARGLYHNGQIYLVASNLNSRATVMRTLGHEAIAHHGLREMLGDEGFSAMMRQINLAVKAGNPAMRKISEYVRRTYVDKNGKFELTPEQEADEIAARAVEDGIDPESGEFRPGFGWLKGVFARVVQFLRDLGITVPMSNTELQGVLVNSMRGLEAGAKLQGQNSVMAAARAGEVVPSSGNAPAQSDAMAALGSTMRRAGWEIEYIDLDLTGEKPSAGIRVKRNDGRFLIAKVDAQGRASFETFQRERSLRMDESTKGRRPLSPMVDDTFLGRQRFEGARSMLRGMTTYLADNALNPIALSDMRSAWAGVMAGPVKQEGALPAPDGDGAMARTGDQTGDIDRAWRDLIGKNKFSDYDSTPETKVTGEMDDFVLSREKGKQWAALNVRELRKDDGTVVYSSSLEVGSEGFPRGTGAATTMYLQALNIAKQRGMGWMSEGVRSDEAQAIYRRLTEAGVPFKEVDGSSVVDAAALKDVDLADVARRVSGDRPMPLFARSAVTGRTITPTWQAPDPTRMDDMIYSMQDKHVDTKRVVTAVQGAIGGIADNLDPYLQEELYHGRAAMATKEFLEKSIRPLLTDMQARGVEMSDFEEYLHNRHAERRNDQVAKVNPNMPDGGSGIKTADARAYLAGLPAAKRTAYQALARRVDQMNRDTRALLVSSGLEKQSTIDAWQAAYGDEYVPLMREEMDNGAMGIGQGFSVRGSSSKRAMGSNKPVANIMANIALQREKAITRAEKRRIGEALYGMVLSAPNPDFWFAVDPALEQNPAQITATAMQLISMGLNPIDAQAIAAEPRQKYIDPRTGQVAERINPVLRSADNVLAVRIDGEDKYVFFNAADPRAMRMAKSLKNLDSDQLGVVMGNVAKMTRYFAAVNTQFNPVFGVVNLTRDIQTALLNLQSTGLAGKQVEVMKHVGSALRGIYIDLRDHRAGKTPTSTWAGLFEEFQREGGATGYRDMYANAQERADAIADELKKIKQGKAMEFGRGVFGWLSDYNESMENAVRLATYKVAKEQGMTNSQAASVAKNLTVNFNRKGQVALQAGAMYAFFNAAVQGTARMAETMFSGGKLSATGKKIMTGGLLLGSMQALLLAAAGYDDEEPPDFVRERSIVIPIGADKYVSIPMPLGFHVIPNLARIPTEWAMGGFKDTPKRLAQLVSLFADAFNPIGSAGLSLQTLAPTIIDPLAALAENKDWTGKQIAKKDFNSMQPTAGHTRAKDTATPWARAIAYGVNWVTGGTDYKPGMASPTPDQIDYLIGQATGGVGREASKLSQVASSTVSGEELPLYKIPLLGRFVGTTTGQAAESGRFYENLKEIGEHDAELSGLKKDRRMAEYQVYLRENPQARLVPIADRTYREVSKLIRMKREALKAGASKERVKMLDQQITARMAQFNARVKATETRETATQ